MSLIKYKVVKKEKGWNYYNGVVNDFFISIIVLPIINKL